MKIYKFKFDLYTNKMNMYEAEVEEKPKTYAVVGNPDGIYERLVSKDQIGVMDRRFDRAMFLLEPDKLRFIQALLVDLDQEINELNSIINKAYKRRDVYLDMIKKEREFNE